jgi:hypothetical protein
MTTSGDLARTWRHERRRHAFTTVEDEGEPAEFPFSIRQISVFDPIGDASNVSPHHVDAIL